MSSILAFVRPGVRAMEGYTPGEQVIDCVKLNTNESPWPPGPRVQDVLASFAADRLRVYPSARADHLREVAAEVYGVSPDMVLAGNGSDDLLTILVRAFVDAGETIACAYPSYGLYETLAALQGAHMAHVPYGADWELPEALGEVDAKLVFVASPNNPSATTASRASVLRIVERGRSIVVVDEAYADFAGESVVDAIATHPNLVVVRSFSKSYSLAGARLGLLFAHADLVAELMKVKDSYNVNAITQALGIAALRDGDYMRAMVEKTLGERRWLEAQLGAMGFCWAPSRANFLLVGAADREQAQRLYRGLREHRILVRHWDRPRLESSVRITVGTRPQNELLVRGIKNIVGP